MPNCPVCGAELQSAGAPCPYDVSLDRAPGIGDIDAIASGKAGHADHELHIARWRVHHPGDRGATPAVMSWARARVARDGHRPG
ncbi:MAG: hypothetical protein HOP28_17860 [Gemmatimonadales bacterium]|nr:hypothetical protein [Gemmatimonadales bacterium]